MDTSVRRYAPDTRFRLKSPPVVVEAIDGEVMVINLETGAYYSVSGASAVVWHSLIGGAPLSSLPVACADTLPVAYAYPQRGGGAAGLRQLPARNVGAAAAPRAAVDDPRAVRELAARSRGGTSMSGRRQIVENGRIPCHRVLTRPRRVRSAGTMTIIAPSASASVSPKRT